MKSTLARFREGGSFIAGLLIGISIVVAVFAMMIADPSDWQALWVFGAPIILALGLTLQFVVTAELRHRRTTNREPGDLAIRFIG
jgi:multisubunit Na+/H+ antiporter MnhB subunit